MNLKESKNEAKFLPSRRELALIVGTCVHTIARKADDEDNPLLPIIMGPRLLRYDPNDVQRVMGVTITADMLRQARDEIAAEDAERRAALKLKRELKKLTAVNPEPIPA